MSKLTFWYMFLYMLNSTFNLYRCKIFTFTPLLVLIVMAQLIPHEEWCASDWELCLNLTNSQNRQKCRNCRYDNTITDTSFNWWPHVFTWTIVDLLSVTGVYTKFSGRLSEEPFPRLIQKLPCILIFKTGQPGCQLNLTEGQIRLDLTSGRPLV